MNLNITYSDEKYIENFINVNILKKTYEEELSVISGASCQNILIPECIQMLEYAEIKNVFINVLSKLRTNGNITLTLIDLEKVLSLYNEGDLNDETMSNIVKDIKSVLCIDFVINSMISSGIVIKSIEKKDFFITFYGSRIKI
jgi:hypothetical protein